MTSPDAGTMLVMSVDGTKPMTRVRLAGDSISVGRDSGNDIVLDDASVSRRHLTLRRLGEYWDVVGGAGTGPLYVNGRECQRAQIRPGDQLAIGGTVLRLEWHRDADMERGAVVPDGGRSTIRVAEAVPTLTIACPGGHFIVPLREAGSSIGRGPDCGLIIPSRVISTHQGTLQYGVDGTYTLVADSQARNHFTFASTPVSRHTFRDGDVIAVGTRESGEYATITFATANGTGSRTGPHSMPLEAPAWGAIASIGRDPASTYCLPSPLVSWHHVRLRRDTSDVLIEDLGSTNGTYINLQRLEHIHRLAVDDQVQIGPYSFRFDGMRLVAETPDGPEAGLPVEALDLVRTTHGGQTVLLDHVTLAVQPGTFVTIIGGNGAGKSTLLKALAGIQPGQIGTVLFAGVDSYRHYDLFRGRIGYVPQADIVHLALRVDEALYYTARLRLSRDLRDEEIEQRIQLVLAAVDLSAHQSKLVGSLSGGERKRLSLAVELLAEPQVLFLDEPNAALDPNHRQELLATIRALAEQGRTLVMVTHFREDFEACHKVAVMGRGGRLCFFGTPTEALAFFHVTSFEDIYSCIEEAASAELWRSRYQQLPAYHRDLQSHALQLSARDNEYSRTRAGWQAAAGSRQTSTLNQFSLLLDRYTHILMRDRINMAILLLQAPVIGVILAAVSKPDAFVSASGPADAEKILFLLAIVAIWFGTSNSVREISKEGDIYQRERLAGLRILPYLLSKVGLLAALCFIQTLVLLVIVTARTGLPPQSAGLFFSPVVELYIGTVLAGLAGLGLGLCVSAFASNPDKAVSAVPLVLLPQILLAGVIFSVSGPVQPVADLTISRWAVEALGTSADLDHLYYVQLHDLAGVGGAGSVATNFHPGDFDNSPSSANYTPSVSPGASWADAEDSRRQRVLVLWSVEGLMCLVFLSIAAVRQRAKDPS